MWQISSAVLHLEWVGAAQSQLQGKSCGHSDPVAILSQQGQNVQGGFFDALHDLSCQSKSKEFDMIFSHVWNSNTLLLLHPDTDCWVYHCIADIGLKQWLENGPDIVFSNKVVAPEMEELDSNWQNLTNTQTYSMASSSTKKYKEWEERTITRFKQRMWNTQMDSMSS